MSLLIAGAAAVVDCGVGGEVELRVSPLLLTASIFAVVDWEKSCAADFEVAAAEVDVEGGLSLVVDFVTTNADVSAVVVPPTTWVASE